MVYVKAAGDLTKRQSAVEHEQKKTQNFASVSPVKCDEWCYKHRWLVASQIGRKVLEVNGDVEWWISRWTGQSKDCWMTGFKQEEIEEKSIAEDRSEVHASKIILLWRLCRFKQVKWTKCSTYMFRTKCSWLLSWKTQGERSVRDDKVSKEKWTKCHVGKRF